VGICTVFWGERDGGKGEGGREESEMRKKVKNYYDARPITMLPRLMLDK